MALYAFDGTGQRDDNPDLEDVRDTNAARFFFAYLSKLALDFVNEITKGKARLADDTIPTIRFLGLFDCVPSFGIPISPLNIGWDLDLPSNVGSKRRSARSRTAIWCTTP